jgi:death-on-curing protein
MELISKELQEDHDRWVKQIGRDEYTSHRTIGILDVLRAHYLIVDYFYHQRSEGVGGVGPKSLNLLHSTLSRQFSGYEGSTKWNSNLEVCASLFWGLIKNHAFHDVNKRTALLSLFYHLVKVGRYPTSSHKTYEDLAINVAANNLNGYRDFSGYKNKPDAEVLFIANFLSQHTRAMEKREFKITYRQLDHILRRSITKDNFSRNQRFGLANPNQGQIDLIRQTEESAGLFGRKTTWAEKKIRSIGFPGWTRLINVDAIKQIRKDTGLTADKGYDSETFYHEADSLPFLIDEFQGLLEKLADK